MNGTYDPTLVVLSILIATFASYVALDLANSVTVARGQARLAWLAGGSLAMGTGIWSMHFIGMLAFRMPGMAIAYDVPLLFLSVAIAIAASGLALFVISRPAITARTHAGAALAMGVAIAGMHYTGMWSMRTGSSIRWSRPLVATSIAIAVVASFVALWIAIRFRMDRSDRGHRLRMVGSGIMGLAITGMHYTAMAAARFSPGGGALPIRAEDVLATGGLAVAVSGTTILILMIAVAGSIVARELERRAALGREIERLYAQERESAQQYRLLASIVESSDDAIVGKDLDGTILSWNAGAERVYGYRADEVVGRSAAFLLAPDRPDEEDWILQRVRSREPLDRLETVRVRKDGSLIDVSLTVSPLTNAGNEVVGASVIARDITLSRRARKELVRAKEEAEAASRAKSDFLSQMSHELRTPLNSVIGFANVLRKNKAGTLREQELGYLDRIAANGKHLLGLINQILDLSKIEAGKMELEIAPVALDALMHETVAAVQGAARPGVELRAAVPASLAPLETDGARLKQVLINLIGNALKFTERGNVTVRIAGDPVTGAPVFIEVADTGIGIPADRLEAIFRPFEQAESGTTRRYEGTGLGLAISRSLCELMGYRLEVESVDGAGSTFRVHFAAEGQPATIAAAEAAVPTFATPPEAEPAEPAEPARGDIPGRLVLVIDDETDARILLTHHLEELGCQTITASTGAQGVRMAREFRPELITLDLLLTGTSGWEVLRTLKADPELRDIPVVIVSVIAAESRGSVLGAVEVIDKPIERDSLRALLRRTVRRDAPRVLVVDDEPDARALLAGFLRDEGAEIRTAGSAAEALQLLESFSPDLLVLDLLMPGTDGMGMLRLLHQRDAYRHLPVVIVTARELSAAELHTIGRDALMVLRKDGQLEEELRAVVQRLGDYTASSTRDDRRDISHPRERRDR